MENRSLPAIIAIVLISLCVSFPSFARLTAEKAFIDAPTSRFPLIPKMKRMDMVDYFNSSVDKSSENILGGESKILSNSPDKIVVEVVGGASDVTSVSLAKYGSDTILIVTSNVATPAIDGMISFYTADWKPLKSKNELFKEPQFSDWVDSRTRPDMSDLRNAIPFVMAEYEYNPETRILTLKSTYTDYLDNDNSGVAGEHLFKELRYKWNGKKMQRIK